MLLVCECVCAGSVGEWHIFNDPGSGLCYYSHSTSGESQWEAPPDVSAIWAGAADAQAHTPFDSVLPPLGKHALAG